MSFGELDRRASSGVAAPERSTPPVSSGSEQVYSHAYRILDLLKTLRAILRVPFYNRLASAAVIGGMLLASGSFWAELLVAAAGDSLRHWLPNVYAVFSSAWQQYKAQIDNFNLIFGTIIAALGLAYHWFAFKFDQELKFSQLREKLARLDEERRLDQALIEKFSRVCPQADFATAVAAMKQNSRVGDAVLLNSRFTFWTDPANRFRAAALDLQRKGILDKHKEVALAFRRSEAGTGEASSQKGVSEALSNLAKTYGELDPNAVYRSLEAEIRKG